MIQLDDTIAAIATAPGASGLAVVRVSGPDAPLLADRVFAGTRRLADARGNTLHHGWAHWPEPADPGPRAPRRDVPPAVAAVFRSPPCDGAPALDEVVAAVFRAPRSYTREHVVELSCHGGRIAGERVLAALLAAGCRLARPGEFTLRAFLNGRLDLAQAEAVADLVRAETQAAHDLALAQLAGALSRRVGEWTDRLAEALAEVEARVDFAEDVGGVEVPEPVARSLAEIEAALDATLAGSPLARAIQDGVRVPIVGRPNVGKSSLFNALIGEERAIVTAHPGTTRDRLSEAIELAGVRVTLSDTAGLREAAEPVEAIGIDRARAALDASRLVVWVVDGTSELAPEDRAIAERIHGKRVVVALNKSDRGLALEPGRIAGLCNGDRVRIVAVSALRGDGLDLLRGSLAELLGAAGSGDPGDPSQPWAAASNPRHVEALERARAAVSRARAIAADRMPGELVALEIREALAALGEITGRTVSDDLLERIFARFCIGK